MKAFAPAFALLLTGGCCCCGGGYREPAPCAARWTPVGPPPAVASDSAPVPPAVPAPAAAAAPKPPHRLSGPGWRGVILRPEGQDLGGLDAEGGLWDPTEDDVRRLEAALPAALKAAVPDLAHAPSEYLRQYVGVLREGRRKIEVRAALPAELDEDIPFWTSVLVVYDGGDGYVDATWDVEKGAFDAIGIHGDA